MIKRVFAVLTALDIRGGETVELPADQYERLKWLIGAVSECMNAAHARGHIGDLLGKVRELAVY